MVFKVILIISTTDSYGRVNENACIYALGVQRVNSNGRHAIGCPFNTITLRVTADPISKNFFKCWVAEI